MNLLSLLIIIYIFLQDLQDDLQGMMDDSNEVQELLSDHIPHLITLMKPI